MMRVLMLVMLLAGISMTRVAAQVPIAPIIAPIGLYRDGSPVTPAPRALITRSAAECVGVTGPEDGITSDSLSASAQIAQIIIPDLRRNRGTEGWTYGVRWTIAADASISSIETIGRTPEQIGEAMMKTMSKFQFRVAVYHGCAVSGTVTIMFTADDHGARMQPPRFRPDTIAAIAGETWVPTFPPVSIVDSKAAASVGCDRGPAVLSVLHPSLGRSEIVDLLFFIDAVGLPIDSTVRVVQSSNASALKKVRSVFPTLRYQVPVCHGAKSSALIEQTFHGGS